MATKDTKDTKRGVAGMFGVLALVGAGKVFAQEVAVKASYEKDYDVGVLVRDDPPRWKDANKKIVWDVAQGGAADEGVMTVTRWGEMGLPEQVGEGEMKAEGRADYFGYEVSASGVRDWYLNFAAADLFAYYGSGLAAQDELQVAEHPALGSLREAMLKDGLSTLVREGTKATPILVRNVPRRVRIATGANASEGRPSGLYGNLFAKADAEVVRRATVKLEPATRSNILAIEAPAYGTGAYTAAQIRGILATAYTGFRAAKLTDGAATRTVIHTGFWGCGAYGGNRVLMGTLQLIAARMAGVEGVVFHAGDKEGLGQYREAQRVEGEVLKEGRGTEAVVERLVGRGFRWGVSDGN